MGTLTELLHRQKNWPEAEISAREAVALCRANRDSGPRLFHALHWQEIILTAQRKWAEAEPVLREVTALCDKLSTDTAAGIEATTCAHLRRALGETLLRLGNHAEAAPLLLASHAVLKDARGRWDAGETKLALEQLVEIYEATDRPAEAAAWKQKLAEFQKAQSDKTRADSRP